MVLGHWIGTRAARNRVPASILRADGGESRMCLRWNGFVNGLKAVHDVAKQPGCLFSVVTRGVGSIAVPFHAGGSSSTAQHGLSVSDPGQCGCVETGKWME